HPPEPLVARRRAERLRGSGQQVRALGRRPVLHGRDSRPRSGNDRNPRPARELLQATGPRLRGADLSHVGPHEPCGPAPRAAGLGDHVMSHYVEAKRAEWDEYRTQVSDWEVEKYLEQF